MSCMPQKHPPASTAFSVVILGFLRPATLLRESSGPRRGEIIESRHPIDNQPGGSSGQSWYPVSRRRHHYGIIDEAASQDAYAHRVTPADGRCGPETCVNR